MNAYLIWSEEHGAWWKPESSGYTDSIKEAGRYTKAQAFQIIHDANQYCQRPGFNEIALPDPLESDHLL